MSDRELIVLPCFRVWKKKKKKVQSFSKISVGRGPAEASEASPERLTAETLERRAE